MVSNDEDSDPVRSASEGAGDSTTELGIERLLSLVGRVLRVPSTRLHRVGADGRSLTGPGYTRRFDQGVIDSGHPMVIADTATPLGAPDTDDTAPDDTAPDDTAPDDTAPDDTAPSHADTSHAGTDDADTVEDADPGDERQPDHGMRVGAYLGVPLYSEDGMVTATLCALDDRPRDWSDEDVQLLKDVAVAITELINLPETARQREAQLGEVQERLRVTLSSAPVAQAMVALNGTLLEVNPALCNLLGYEADELVGMTFQQITRGDDLADDRLVSQQLMAGGTASYSEERRFFRRDGIVVWGWPHVALVRDPEGVPLYFLTQIEDASERRDRQEHIQLASEELIATNIMLGATTRLAQINEERYRALVDHLPDTVVCVFDRERRFSVVSGRSLEASGIDAAGLIGKTLDEFLPPDPAAAVGLLLDAAFAGRSSVTELDLLLSGAESLLEVVPLAPLRGSEPEEVLLVARNIERFKQRERELGVAEARWRAAFDEAPVAIAELSLNGRTLGVNPALCELAGWSADELEQQPLLNLVHPDDRESVTAWTRAVAAGGGLHSFVECRFTRRDGKVRWVRARGAVMKQTDGSVPRVLVHMSDYTVERENQDRITAAHARFSALVEHGADVIAILDRDLIVRYASPSYWRVFGVDQEEALGTHIAARFHADDVAEAQALLDAVLESPGGVAAFETRILQPDGSWRWLEVTTSNRFADPAVEGLVCNCRDVTERVEATTLLAHQATHDVLTNLPNRALLLDRLHQTLARAERSGRPCALFFIDIDHFKRVNDTLGHALGDQLLVTIAQRLDLAIRPGDSVARLGGDEFVVLAEDIAAPAVAIEIAERIRNAINQPVTLGSRKLAVSCSVGIALSDGHQSGSLFQAADAALYRAKQQGRDRWEIYDVAMGAAAQQQLDTEDLLRAALDDDRLAVVYQPIVDLRTAEAIGAEALARIRDPRGSLLAPVDFISVAEDCGLIVPLGTGVLERACAQYDDWRSALRYISVNVSGRQMLAKSFPETVINSLERFAMKPDQLCLEFTETSIIDAGSDAYTCISELKDLGVQLALDDFGTGWSSLGHLRRFPIDVIKIDRSFIAGLGVNSEDGEVIRAVIGLGSALGMTTIAEGIETVAQATELQLLGCSFGQGNYYGPPRLPEEHSAPEAASFTG